MFYAIGAVFVLLCIPILLKLTQLKSGIAAINIIVTLHEEKISKPRFYWNVDHFLL